MPAVTASECVYHPDVPEDGSSLTLSPVTAPERAPGDAADLAERLRFESLVSDLSATFVNLAAGEVDSAIEDAQRRIVEELGLDRSSLFQLDASGNDLLFTHQWARAGMPAAPDRLSARESFPALLERVLAGDVVAFSSVDDVQGTIDRETLRRFGAKSNVTIPLKVGGRIIGALAFGTISHERAWPPTLVNRLGLMATVFANALARKRSDRALHDAHAEVVRLKDRLSQENVYLRQAARENLGTPVVGRSPAILRVLEQVRQVAATDATVLLLGETGTGKELFAAQIHDSSARRDRTMVRVNCAAIPSALVESELFGREKGAYTGALSRQLGRFEAADQSTIFLDEIGDLPAEVQVKLLRVLENRQIERLGSPRPIKVDTRIIAATHRNLESAILEGRFREDLFYRLNVFPIVVPPLRDRLEDVQPLVERFVEDFSTTFGKRVDSIARSSMTALQQYAWPGNVRELRNVVERAMIITSGGRLVIEPPVVTASNRRHSMKLVDVEEGHIRAVLAATNWRVRGPGGAAEQLGLKPTTLESRMNKLGLRRPKV
jgi:formate hydrogenlyase transcriptional activator